MLSRSICFAAAFTFGVATVAGAQVTAIADIQATNFANDSNPGDVFPILTGDFTNTAGMTVSATGQFSFDGFDSGYADQTMTLTGSSRAWAVYQSLKAEASATVDNAFYNPDNTPYYDGENDVVNEDGMPDYLAVNGQASFSEKLLSGGTATAYTSTYLLNLSGSIVGDGEAFVFIELQHGFENPETYFYNVSGDYSIPIVSQTYVTGGGGERFSMRMLASFQADLANYNDNTDLAGSADFFNTFDFVAIEARDADTGELLPAGSITGETSGATYTIGIAAVPEPGTAVALGSSLSLLLLRRRTK